jgi:ribonuclease-3
MPDLSQLSARLGYEFTNESLLETAMHHRSWNAENEGGESNERLEFLGDAVLGWVVADIVYTQHSDLPEGKLGIGEHLMLGKGEDTAGGREKTSILSDALEAVIGAVYIDAGPQATHDVVSALMGKRIVDAVGGLDRLDAKTRLQELASKLEAHVHYKVEDEGPDHEKMFFATVFVGDRELGYGEGKSKKAAEQIAAEIACDVLNSELPA